MTQTWQEELSCATQCAHCGRTLHPDDQRILSFYDHHAICLYCKDDEEKRPDFPEVSMSVAESCLIHAESGAGDPRGYCYHHFYPYRCG